MTEGGAVAEKVVLALDAEGGDRGPAEIISGALQVAGPDLHVHLVGRPEHIRPHLPQESPALAFIDVEAAGSVISFHEEPAWAVRSKPDSSIAVGARLVAGGHAQGFVSAGSTGAMVAAGLLLVKRIRQVKRPAILVVLPGRSGPVAMLDAGANADCRPEYLLDFGVMGSAFAHAALGVPAPRVGLLNIGEEEGKGNELSRAAHALLTEAPITFVGNIEGRDLFSGKVDVVVTDGFTGNVALKLMEGTAGYLLGRVREAASGTTRSKVGGLLLRPALRGVKEALDPDAYGGSYLLGLRGLLIICHGASTSPAIANALTFGARAVRGGVLAGLEAELGRVIPAGGAGPGAT